EPHLVTDAAGVAELTVRAADSLTAWRFDALASTAAGGVAHADATARVAQPFSADIDAPPFLRQGDTCEVAGVVRNDTGERLRVRVRVELVDVEPRAADGAPPIDDAPTADTTARRTVAVLEGDQDERLLVVEPGGSV